MTKHNPLVLELRDEIKELKAINAELLEALRIVCEYFEADYDRPNEYYVAEAAIARAEGR